MVWLYSAMVQSIRGRARSTIHDYSNAQDGIVCWKHFLDEYRYGGNVDVYLVKEQQTLRIRFTRDYPGGKLAFLEAYEDAFLNIDHVLERNPSLAGTGGLFTDEGKRKTFLPNFLVTDINETLIDIVEHSTSTWGQMVTGFRKSLASRELYHDNNHNPPRRHCHVVNVATEQEDHEQSYPQLPRSSNTMLVQQPPPGPTSTTFAQ